MNRIAKNAKVAPGREQTNGQGVGKGRQLCVEPGAKLSDLEAFLGGLGDAILP